MPILLRTLRVRDLVIIEDLTVDFAAGLNLLTGETGAGKSIVVDALGLIAGDRADRTLVRSGAERVVVEALFELSQEEPLARWLADRGVELGADPPELLVRRELPASGSGRVLLNGSPQTVAQLRELGARLVARHAQHDQQELLSAEHQSAILDAFGGHASLLEQVAAARADLREAERRQVELDELAAGRQARREQLQRTLREIEGLAPRAGELAELDRERSLLRNAGRLAELLDEVVLRAYEGEPSAAELAAGAARCAGELARIDPTLAPLAERVRSAAVELQDAGAAFRDYRDRAEFDPGRLDEVESRRAAIEHLSLLHGADEAGLVALAGGAAEELERLDGLEQELAAAGARRRQALEGYARAAAELTAAREAAGPRLAAAVRQQLAALALAGVRFEVGLRPLRSADPAPPASERGVERAEFRLAANAGEPLRPLARAASGGELSRIMLALHGVADVGGDGRVLVFDEIDTGVGGSAADAIGARLAALGRRRQVLCVTHLPQVAAHAHSHFRVHKQVRGGRTVAAVASLTRERRVEELARMLGARRPTEASRRHAAELLQAADRGTTPAPRRQA